MKYFAIMYLIFHTKHLLADFPLQMDFMRLGKLQPSNWLTPLLMHCGVHAVGTLGIVWGLAHHFSVPFSGTLALMCAGFDFMSHFFIDLLRARPFLLGRFKPESRFFWWSLGFDQYAHHVCNLAMIVWITAWLSTAGMVPG